MKRIVFACLLLLLTSCNQKKVQDEPNPSGTFRRFEKANPKEIEDLRSNLMKMSRFEFAVFQMSPLQADPLLDELKKLLNESSCTDRDSGNNEFIKLVTVPEGAKRNPLPSKPDQAYNYRVAGPNCPVQFAAKAVYDAKDKAIHIFADFEVRDQKWVQQNQIKRVQYQSRSEQRLLNSKAYHISSRVFVTLIPESGINSYTMTTFNASANKQDEKDLSFILRSLEQSALFQIQKSPRIGLTRRLLQGNWSQAIGKTDLSRDQFQVEYRSQLGPLMMGELSAGYFE